MNMHISYMIIMTQTREIRGEMPSKKAICFGCTNLTAMNYALFTLATGAVQKISLRFVFFGHQRCLRAYIYTCIRASCEFCTYSLMKIRSKSLGYRAEFTMSAQQLLPQDFLWKLHSARPRGLIKKLCGDNNHSETHLKAVYDFGAEAVRLLYKDCTMPVRFHEYCTISKRHSSVSRTRADRQSHESTVAVRFYEVS